MPCEELAWHGWFESAERHVGDDTIRGVRISTVFLGLDHNFFGEGPPILWETMVFGGRLHGEMRRYSSRADAVRGHALFVTRVDRSDRRASRGRWMVVVPSGNAYRYAQLSAARAHVSMCAANGVRAQVLRWRRDRLEYLGIVGAGVGVAAARWVPSA